MQLLYVILDGDTEFSSVERYTEILPYDRKEKIRRLRNDSDKLLSAAAGFLLEYVFPNAKLRYNEHRKPYLADTDGFFSLTHSGSLAAIAVDSSEVGIDAELIGGRDRIKIADRFFCEAERDSVYNSDDRDIRFLEIWTAKEAYLKRSGTGITIDLTSFDVTSEEISGNIATFRIDDYVISVCSSVPLSKRDVEITKLSIEDILQRISRG